MDNRNYLNRIFSVRILEKSFVPEGQTEPVDYVQLALGVDFQGEHDEIVLKLDRKTAQLLRAADVKKENALD